MKLISAIIPTYNHGAFIREAINSALAQTYKNYEIIIVDDGSTDDTASIVRKFISSVGQRHEIRYIYQENSGPSSARNKGIKEAKGDYVAFLDSDDMWEPDKLAKQVRYMETNNLRGLCCAGYDLVNEAGTQIGAHQLFYENKRDVLRDLLIRNVVSTCSTVMVNRECFDIVGLFDESLQVAEDWDMWIRLIRKYDFSHIPESLVKVRVRTASQSASGDKNLQNDLKFLGKLFSDPELKNRHIVKARAYSARYLSAAIAYRENGRLSDMRACALKAGSLYPPHIFSKKFLGLVKSTVFPK
jgi:glycosyltransferase involved in cell wall biosynthesis